MLLYIVLALIAIGIIIALVKFLFKALVAIVRFLGKAIYYILAGPALGVSFLCGKLLSVLHLQGLVALGCFTLPLFLQKIYSATYPELTTWSNGKSFVFFAFLVINTIVHIGVISRQKKSVKIDCFKTQNNSYYRYLYASILLFLQGFALFYLFTVDDISNDALVTGVLFDGLLMAFSVGMFINTLVKEVKYTKKLKLVYDTLAFNDKINATSTLSLLPDSAQSEIAPIQLTSIQQIALGIAQKMIGEQRLVDISLLDDLWFIKKEYYDEKLLKLNDSLSQEIAITENQVASIVENEFGFTNDESKDFADRYLDFGEYHYFDNEKKFVSYENQPRILVCASCGNTKEITNEEDFTSDWYCSELCKETDEICIAIKEKPYDEFLSTAAVSGIVVMDSANKWDVNNRSLVGSQPHGTIAERYNDMVDTMQGKKVIPYAGGDNAKGGADRIVNGQGIQTKYCETAGKSVGAAFKGENSSYGYFDDNGNPMPVEVPKDQYAQAIKIMESRIKAGKIDNIDKVSGATEAEKAKNLVVKGHATYNQARAMTKFGTLDSLKFDIMDGSVIALKASGISFCISATMAYINTKNPKEALRIAVISGGKTAARSLVIFVGAQQLHRLEVVNTLVNKVDVSVLPKNMSKFIEKGYGVATKGAANRALRGTIVTSVVVIAVTTGPDLLKMVQGRISGAQFVKNIAVASSGVAGGVIGSIVGGAVLSPLGPVGLFIGKTAGGIIGGMVAAQVTNKIAKNFMEEDRDVMMRIVTAQIKYLARAFMLSEEEVDNLNTNLTNIVTNDNLERMFASDSPKAFSNFLIKPVVVSIVKQRPIFEFNEEDVIDACAEVVA